MRRLDLMMLWLSYVFSIGGAWYFLIGVVFYCQDNYNKAQGCAVVCLILALIGFVLALPRFNRSKLM